MRARPSLPTLPVPQHRLRFGGHILTLAAAVGAALVLTALLGGFGGRRSAPLRAERIELVSEAGAVLAVLGADTAGMYVLVLDRRGRPASRLRLSREPWLSVQTGTGDEAAGLGSPRPHPLSR